MTAYAARPPRAGQRVYVSQTMTVQDSPTHYTIRSHPHPIHHARVYQRERHGLWTVDFVSLWHSRAPRRYADLREALSAACEVIGRKAGADLMTFTGAQRTVMGRQCCPKRQGSGLCGLPAEVGTVWCQWHPKGGDIE